MTRGRARARTRAKTKPNVRQNFHSAIRKRGARASAKRAPPLEDFVDGSSDVTFGLVLALAPGPGPALVITGFMTIIPIITLVIPRVLTIMPPMPGSTAIYSPDIIPSYPVISCHFLS